MSITFRFAPSPNGRLHLGHAYSALLNYRLAAQTGGRFLLRVEDIDTTRCAPEYTQQMLEDLRWLGVSWEEPVRVQSHHFGEYQQALAPLKTRGLVYPCFCSRTQIAAISTGADPDGAPLYPGTCRALPRDQAESRIAKGEQHSWRLDMQAALAAAPGPYEYVRFALPAFTQETVAAQPQLWGDVILARKETPTSYHLSVVSDDALQDITHIVRGADLEASTDLHVLLQKLLGLPTPLYHHHALLKSGEGEKLSKSKQSETLADLRAQGITPEDVIALVQL